MSGKSLILVTVAFVLGLAQAGLAQADPDLIGWWRLDEGGGNTVADVSRYGNRGTLVGGPKWVAGKIGSALQFDGTDDYVRCVARVGSRPGTYPAELMPATFTVACWTKLDNFAFFSSFGGNGTGAAVGHDIWDQQSAYYGSSITEIKDVHGGYQALPLYYDNTATPFYSETERTWKAAQDWTVNGVTDLTLYVRGEPDNGPAPLYIAIEDSAGHVAIVTHPDSAIATAKNWTEWKIPLSDLTNAKVTLTAVKKMYIGVGSRSASTAGGTGVVYLDDIRLTKPAAGGM